MAAQRLVSVIIGTRNRPDTLRQALASIRALEGPDLTFEILVGDNGSTPETRDVVAEFGGIYERTDVYGCPAARNLAMRRATGEFIAFLDDDDVWLPGHVRPHIALMDSHPEFEAVFGQNVTTDENLVPVARPWPEELPADGDMFKMMMSGYFPQVGATVVRGSALKKYGLMDESLIGDSDWDWQLQIARDHRIGHVRVPCVLFRQRPRGSFDSLQLKRASYTRKIFLRHALPNRKRWSSPVAMLRAYYGSVTTYFSYFMDAAEDRAARGDRIGAVKAIASAFWIFPTRAAKALVGKTPLSRSVSLIVSGGASRISPAAASEDLSERIDISLGFDRNFAPHAAVVAASVVSRAPGARFRFIILHTDVDAEIRASFERAAPGAEFVWKQVGEDDLPPFAPHVQFTRASLFRLGLEKLAPADCKRVIYLDADIVVMDDIRALWRTDLGDAFLGAVRDEHIDAAGFAARWSIPATGYFNSGILLIDLERVRSEKLFGAAADFIIANDRQLEWKDQDALNWVCRGRWVEIDPTWNVQRTTAIAAASGEPSILGGKAPRIIHYTGREKPWIAGAYHPWSWAYWQNLRLTPFASDVAREQGVGALERARVWLRWVRRGGRRLSPRMS